MTLQVADTIPLTLKLWDGDTGKFVRATVVDSDGTSLGVITLTHISDGFYQDDSLVMPNKEYVTAYYIVYDDAGFTTRSAAHQDSSDVFTLTPIPTEIVKKVQDIIVTVDEPNIQEIVVTVDSDGDNDIQVELPDESEVDVSLDEDIKIEVEEDEEITVTEDC